MVKITLEYKSVDEAIVALGKLVGAPGKVAAPAATAATLAAPVAPTTEKTPRKPRADRGQPRAPYAPRQEDAKGEGASAPTGQASAASPAPAAPTPAASEEQARALAVDKADATPSADDAQKALEKLFEATNIETAKGVIAEFGVPRLRDLPADKRAAFVEACQKKMPAK